VNAPVPESLVVRRDSPPDLRWRFERKFVAREQSVAEVLVLIRLHPAVFREVYPTRAINNLYLDTPFLDDYFDHINGNARRLKTRIRWYGRLRGAIEQPVLEQKIKRGLVNGKRSYRLPPLQWNGSVDPVALTDSFDRAGLPQTVRSRLHHLQPALVNRYRRYYLESADRRFRLTVDADLEFHCTKTTASHSEANGHAGLVILELKFDTAYADAAAGVVNAFPFRLSRCSKYVLGIERLQPR
jgi:hypothetical protein